jgi:hypothetical protein
MNLTQMRANVAADLDDAGGDIWSSGELERAIRRALREYSDVCPYRADVVIELEEDGREVDLSDVGELAGVERVWYPYDATSPDWPPRWREFACGAGGVLTLLVSPAPTAGESLMVYYWTPHRLSGLDSATETTLPAADEEIVALGAAGYAALEKSRAAVGQVNVSGYTPLHWAAWAERRLVVFEERLKAVCGRRAALESGPAAMA